jgi:cobalt/nickel transport system ATP-binding protein
MSAESDELLRLDDVHFAHEGARDSGGGRCAILRGLTFRLHAGERVALIGPNGAGKTTLLHLLVGLKRPSAGEVVAFGEARRAEADFRPVRARVGLLFQHSDDQLFCPTVLDDVAFGPLNLGLCADAARARALQTLARLGLGALAERVTHRLSSGEKRLVALATVLAMQPDVLLLDEPTNGLDEDSERRLISHLAELQQAMLIVSHDRGFLEQIINRAVVLKHGRLTEAVLHRHPHRHRHVHLHLHTPDDGALHADESATAAPAHPDHHVAEYPPSQQS